MNLRHYSLVTGAYWAFTLTDGALRMLVLLHFARLGYSPVQLAFLFLLYEFCGILTNLLGGWLASRMGLRITLLAGLFLQVTALGLLAGLNPAWPEAWSVAWVMGAQALSGIAKDLTKMSSKSAIKVLVPADARGTLFRWVAVLTGSKNALKGVGFFLGGWLLVGLGYTGALLAMAGGLLAVWLVAWASLPAELGKAKTKVGFSQLFAKSRAINVLSAARLFLFGARDIWFVVGVPVFLSTTLGWSGAQVGGFMASWVIGYGVIQSGAPALLRGRVPAGGTAALAGFLLAAVAAVIPLLLAAGLAPGPVMVGGLALFGAVFALNSAIHSYLILDYTDGDKVALNVGFYYMANAGGRLIGCLLSGVLYQTAGLAGCLWGTFGFAVVAAGIALALPRSAAHPERLAASERVIDSD
ncbi:Major Facilitator Superfamily protein [Lacunisphaera limnophila]|uniref:Major Facilitator Superfamily protein n=1 Tax=Lacunisphaera limnophila TaxID=1838286 RepID=A0A1D8AS61_9BACT|nr:organoarsenical effux MFS transporter ArsJ [Lacunisphaera limnophila]AOS43734.1 Major Facilitator Superfamily protein [Lacunisphaera limnophila]